MTFAKLYETDEYGQILVMLDSNEDYKPSVLFYTEPDGLGVSSVGPAFEDSDAGWDKAETFFKGVDETMARKFAQALLEALDL